MGRMVLELLQLKVLCYFLNKLLSMHFPAIKVSSYIYTNISSNQKLDNTCMKDNSKLFHPHTNPTNEGGRDSTHEIPALGCCRPFLWIASN